MIRKKNKKSSDNRDDNDDMFRIDIGIVFNIYCIVNNKHTHP